MTVQIKSHIFPLFSAILLLTSLARLEALDTADPPDKIVRVFYLQPSDVADDPNYPDGIAKVMYEAQRYFLDQCKYTFKLNNPVCEVIKGDHPTNWYITTPTPWEPNDDYWWSVDNMAEEIKQKYPAVNADTGCRRWKVVGYINAKGNGGGGAGWVYLPKHDADGAAGYSHEGMGRWYGGMCHELGHAFGLPDASSTDGTVMSASFYAYPNCVFNSGHVSSMKNNPANDGFWFPEITDLKQNKSTKKTTKAIRNLYYYYSNGRLQVKFDMTNQQRVSIDLFNTAGKKMMDRFIATARAGKNVLDMKLPPLRSGLYLCTFTSEGLTSYRKVMIKGVH